MTTEQIHDMTDRELLVMACTEIQNIKDSCNQCDRRMNTLENHLWAGLVGLVLALVAAVFSFFKRG